MEFSHFDTLKEGLKDNEDLMSVVTELETQAKTLSGNKEDAVGEVKKFKEVKHSIAELFGLEKDVSASDLVTKAKDSLSEYQRKIDSFKTDASGKDIENAQIKEQLTEMQDTLNAFKKERDDLATENKLSAFKEKFRDSMNNHRIKDKSKQDDVIRGYLQDAMNSDDLDKFVSSIAEKKPYLTDSVHKGGAGSKSYNGDSAVKSLRDIDLKDTEARTKAIRVKLEAKGKI